MGNARYKCKTVYLATRNAHARTGMGAPCKCAPSEWDGASYATKVRATRVCAKGSCFVARYIADAIGVPVCQLYASPQAFEPKHDRSH